MKRITLSLLAIVATVVMASAQAPARFNYQGIARTGSGAPLSSQPLSMRISIHDGAANGSVVYQETHNTTTNPYGLYNVPIGGGAATIGSSLSNVDWASGDKYIQVEIDASGGTAYSDLGTAQLLSVPYALSAGNGSLSGTTNYVPKFTSSTGIGNSQILDDGTSVSIGTTAPIAKLHVNGSSNITATVSGITLSNVSVLAQTSTTTTSQSANAVVGIATNSTRENYGVVGVARPTMSGSSSNVGGYFFGLPAANSTGNSYGVYGVASTGAINIGIYGNTGGISSSTNYAGYFNGNVAVTGYVAKAGGSFKIDHPLDPENKYLYHSFVESPDMMNIYNGNTTTDAHGYATITMPDYFDALNKDFRYQLTSIGVFAQAIVKEEMQGNKFVIQTSQPNTKVSWQVTGIRHDKYADAHRIVPEAEKEPALKGLYIHAEEWGQPVNKSISKVIAPPVPVAVTELASDKAKK